MRDQLAEHLKFAAALGVAGVSTDPAWRARPDDARPIEATQPMAAPESSSDISPLRVMSVETLEAIKADIGDDCSRCKLHTLGRKQIVFGVRVADAEQIGRAHV